MHGYDFTLIVVQCTKGTMYSATLKVCVKCERGFYQAATQQSSCVKCEEDYTTAGLGSDSQSECYRK